MPLDDDVKDELVKLLAQENFRCVPEGSIEKENDYYIKNSTHNRTYFCVLKEMKKY